MPVPDNTPNDVRNVFVIGLDEANLPTLERCRERTRCASTPC